jgi:DNA-binding SARP family transcriptional activator/tetratricopeptide (TPR) repeat protein
MSSLDGVASHPHLESVHDRTDSPPVQLHLFGGPRFLVRGEPVHVPTQASVAAAVTAAHGGRGVSQGTLLRLLWRSGTESALRGRLNQTLYDLKKHLDGAPVISQRDGRCFINLELVGTDLDRFHLLLADRFIEEAAQLAEKGFMSDLDRSFSPDLEQWIRQKEIWLKGKFRTVAAQLWEESLHRADWQSAEVSARALLELWPQEEDFLRRVLTVLGSTGRVDEGAAVFDWFEAAAKLHDPAWMPDRETSELKASLPDLARDQQDRRFFRRLPGFQDPPLVGRTEEAARLRSLLRAPSDTAVQVLIVSGEAGVGKTRLAQEVLRIAPLDGTRVLLTRCTSAEQGIPLCPLVSALDQGWIREHVESMADPWRGVILQVAPQLAPPRRQSRGLPRIGASAVTQRMCEAFLRLLTGLAETDPIALFVDDSQWLDASTIAVLEYVRSRWKAGALTIATTLRTDEPAAVELPPAFRVQGHATKTFVLELRPLPEADQHELLDSVAPPSLPPAARAQMLSLADGNPYLLLELAHARLLSQADPTFEDPLLPPALVDFFRLRLDSIDPSQRSVIDALASALEPVAPGALGKILDRPISEIQSAIGELDQIGWLEWTAEGATLRHELVRWTALKQLSAGRRAFLAQQLLIAQEHGTLAHAASEETGRAVRRAYYYLIAEEPQRALEAGLKAVRLARETGEYLECIQLLDQVRRQLRELTPAANLVLAQMHLATGRPGKAVQLFREAEIGFRQKGRTKKAVEAKLSALRAATHSSRSGRDELREKIRAIRCEVTERGWFGLLATALDMEIRVADSEFDYPAIAELILEAEGLYLRHQVGDETQVRFLLTQSLAVFYLDPEKGLRAARKAAALASGSDPTLELRAHNTLAVALIQLGALDSNEGRAIVQKMQSLAESSGDLSLRTYALMNWAVWHIDTWRPQAAVRLLHACVDELQAQSPTQTLATVQLNLALGHTRMADWDLAAEHLHQARSMTTPAASSSAQATLIALNGLISMEKGRIAEARECKDKLLSLPQPWCFDPTTAAELIATVEWRTGKQERAIAFLEDAIASLGSRMPLHRLYLLNLLSRFQVRSGGLAAARSTLEKAQNEARRFAVPSISEALATGARSLE